MVLFRWLLPSLVLVWSFTAQAWVITDFNVEATLQADGRLQIEETIVADFSQTPSKHGIFRDLPNRYQDAEDRTFITPITQVEVKNEAGQPRKFTSQQVGANKSLKIGDPDKYVNTTETYVINYTVAGVINSFPNHDELYWNVTGNDWEAPIKKTRFILNLPANNQGLKHECYTGRSGSTQTECQSVSTQPNQLMAATNATLQPGEGLTIVAGFDTNLVPIIERRYPIDFTAWFKKLQYLFLLFPAWVLLKIQRLRQSVAVNKPVIPIYQPPKNLSLGQVTWIDHHKTTTQDLTALITQLCVKGVMHIETQEHQDLWGRRKPSFWFIPTQKKAVLTKPEKFVYDRIFTVNKTEKVPLNRLLNQKGSIFHYLEFDTLGLMISGQCQDFRFEPVNKKAKAAKSILKFVIPFLFIIPGSFITTALAESPLPIFALLGGALIYAFKPKLNRVGAEHKHTIKGYKKFLKTAEKERINWSEAQHIFEKNLPYAIAFGLTDKWAKVFGDKIKTPDWYHSQNKALQIGILDTHLKQAAGRAIAASRPKSHSTGGSRGSSGFGGGRSGGGFGGGGGRSW